MKFSALWLLPSVVFSGPVSGIVTLLDGTPLAKAFVRLGTDTMSTKDDGTFILNRQSGIVARPGPAKFLHPTMLLDNGRLRLSFQGTDLLGRGGLGSSAVPGKSFARQMATPVLNVFWKSKNLVTINLPADTGLLSIRLDTAWRDDRYIPWNPRVEYGSLRDSRDGTTYRTVQIGGQTWMAENLTFTDAHGYLGVCWGRTESGCFVKGRLYWFGSAIGGDTTALGEPIQGRIRGICPSGWHLPSDAEWTDLGDWVAKAALPGPSLPAMLKSTSGWALPADQGTDLLGFHVTPTGYYEADNITTNWYNESVVAIFWSSSGTKDHPRSQWIAGNSALLAMPREQMHGDEVSIRCLKD